MAKVGGMHIPLAKLKSAQNLFVLSNRVNIYGGHLHIFDSEGTRKRASRKFFSALHKVRIFLCQELACNSFLKKVTCF